MDSVLAEAALLVGDWRIWVAAAVTVLGGLMRGYSGFGTAILLAPAYSTLWGPLVGVPLLLMMELVTSLQLAPRAAREADLRVVLPIGGAAVLATPLGALVLLQADPELLRRGIGAFVLVFGLLLMSSWRYRGTRPLALNLAVGGVAGLFKGATGISGPPVILYMLSGPEAARLHRANLILFFAVISVASMLPPAIAGLFGWSLLAKALLLLPALLLAVPLGARLFGVVPQRWYRHFALVLLVGAGAVTLLV